MNKTQKKLVTLSTILAIGLVFILPQMQCTLWKAIFQLLIASHGAFSVFHF